MKVKGFWAGWHGVGLAGFWESEKGEGDWLVGVSIVTDFFTGEFFELGFFGLLLLLLH